VGLYPRRFFKEIHTVPGRNGSNPPINIGFYLFAQVGKSIDILNSIL
jgi:hypothetical protein